MNGETNENGGTGVSEVDRKDEAAVQSDTPAPIERLKTSRVPATVGRVVHLHCPAMWDGPRPATVVREIPREPILTQGGELVENDGHVVALNVSVDGGQDAAVLGWFRGRASGNTFTSVPLYDALNAGERSEVVNRWPYQTSHAGEAVGMWAEWPPRV